MLFRSEILISYLEKAPCIGSKQGETYKVLDCHNTNIGYTCQLLANIPTDIETFSQLHPVHYEGIGLSGENENHLFAKQNGETKVLNCTESDFHRIAFPFCEVLKFDGECGNSLKSSKIRKNH